MQAPGSWWVVTSQYAWVLPVVNLCEYTAAHFCVMRLCVECNSDTFILQDLFLCVCENLVAQLCILRKGLLCVCPVYFILCLCLCDMFVAILKCSFCSFSLLCFTVCSTPRRPWRDVQGRVRSSVRLDRQQGQPTPRPGTGHRPQAAVWDR